MDLGSKNDVVLPLFQRPFSEVAIMLTSALGLSTTWMVCAGVVFMETLIGRPSLKISSSSVLNRRLAPCSLIQSIPNSRLSLTEVTIWRSTCAIASATIIGTLFAIPSTPLSSPSIAQYVRFVSSFFFIPNLWANCSVIMDTEAPLSIMGLIGFFLNLASILAAVNVFGVISALKTLLPPGGIICFGGGLCGGRC